MKTRSLSRAVALFQAALLCGVLSSCGGGGGELAAPPPAPVPAPAPPAVAPDYVYINEVDVIKACQVDGAGALSNCVDATVNSGANLAPTLAMAVGGDHAYITILDGAFDSAALHCSIGADSSLFGCTPTGTVTERGGLDWVTLHGSTLYVGGSRSPRVQTCVVKADGSLEPCTDATVPDSLADSVKDLQIAGTTAYLLLNNEGTPEGAISVCQVSGDGTLSNCEDAGVAGLAATGPSSLTAHGNHLYVANSDQNNVIRCVIDASDGSLDNCTDSGAQGLANPSRVAIRGSTAYITNYDSSSGLTRCTVANEGLLRDCASVPGMGTLLYGILFR